MLAYLNGASNPRNAYPAFRAPFEVQRRARPTHSGYAGEGGPPVCFRSIPVVEWPPVPSMSGRSCTGV
jgi:hypothetical protein